jgi:hypothetical protein
MRDDEGNGLNDSFTAFAYHVVEYLLPNTLEFLCARLSYGIVICRKHFLHRQSSQTGKVGNVTAWGGEGIHIITLSDSASLHFSEEADDSDNI